MRKTRKDTATKHAVMSEVNKELGVENTALAKTMEEIMAKYFHEADERSEARNARLEKRLDSTMHATLSRHTEDIKSLRTDSNQLQECVSQTEERLLTLSNRVVEMEDRARRDNVLIFNLQEGIEGSNVLAYLKENVPRWFPSFQHDEGSPSKPEMMRVHRLGPERRTGSTPARGQRPRPVVVRLLRFTDRDLLLKEAREKPPEVAGRPLKFAADYSEVTSKRRKPCYKIMHEARTQGFSAFLLYPAIIKLHRGSENYTFNQPEDAEKCLASLKKNSPVNG